MNTSTFELSQLGRRSEAVELPAELVGMLKAEARAQRKSVAATIADWLQEQAANREAERRWKSLQSGKTKAVPAEDVYKRLGI